MKKFGLAALLLTGLASVALLLAACQGQAGTQGERGPAGPQGAQGTQGQAGPAGATGPAGLAGPAGAQGPAGIAGAGGAQGPAGKDAPLPPGVDRQVAATLAVSKPANGTNFVAGESAVVTVTLKDQFGTAFTKDDFSSLGLYMYGPQETAKTVSAVKLLNATTDRTKTPHHYIDLMTNTDVKVAGNVLTYNLKPVTDEEAGTYTVALRAAEKAAPLQQAMLLTDVQIKTATVEKQIVEKEKCASCHLGADSGKYYFAHIDPRTEGLPGSYSLDSVPVRTCKSCHNNEGYAAYRLPTDTNVRVPDQIVNRVHGVHMGEHLKNPLNTDPKTGIFRAYTGVVFPANVKNCTACHVDDRWKTQPSRLACGTCHDNTWFGEVAAKPATATAHAGGPQANDTACAACHAPDAGLAPISVVHKVEQPMNKVDVKLTAPANGKFYVAGEKPTLTLVIKDDKDAPIPDHTKINEAFSTATFMVYGPRDYAKPVLTNAAKNGASVLRASASSSIAATGTPKAWTFAAGDTFKIAIHGNPVQELAAPEGAQTPDQVVAWLKANLTDAANLTITANATAGSVTIKSNIQGANSKFEFYNSAVTTKMGWKPGPLDLIRAGVKYGQTPGTTMEPYVVAANASTQGVNLRTSSDPLDYNDPLVVRTAANVTYQLDDVATLKPGTYMVYAYNIPSGVTAGSLANPGPGGTPSAAAKAQNVSRTGIGFMTFQVGSETPSKKVATNCSDCHGNTIWHLDEGPIHAEPFDTDYCLACHDYGRTGTGEGFARVGGTSTSGWAGYGAKPISARVHNVHFGRYLDKPEEIYAGATGTAASANAFNEIIFPQDVRNCSKCHSAATTGTWKTQPSRLACLACHDSDEARTHGKMMTQLGPSMDPYGKDAIETCDVCHGAGREFSPDKAHNISNPYKPPYVREPME